MILQPHHTLITIPTPEPDHIDPATWKPGDPLYQRRQNAGDQYRMQIYTFRDDSEAEECSCGDRADWPGQLLRRLPDGDELGDFIAAEKAAREC